MGQVRLIIHIAAAGAWLGANLVQIAGQRSGCWMPPAGLATFGLIDTLLVLFAITAMVLRLGA